MNQTPINKNCNNNYTIIFKNNYSKETINNLKQKNIIIIKTKNELINVIKSILDNNTNNKKQKYVIGTLNDKTKKEIELYLNEKIFKQNQYSLLFSSDSIKHVSEHFSTPSVIARELIRTTRIINSFNKICIINEKGEKRLIFEKKYKSGIIRTIQTTSKSNNSLNLVTIYYTKKRNQVTDVAVMISKDCPQPDSISN